jgi:hypothetical protein
VHFDGLWCEPRPTRPGGPPVLFGGRLYPRNVRRIVQLGDGWVPHPQAGDGEIAEGVEVLRSALRSAGRDPDELRVHAMRAATGPGGAGDVDAVLGRLGDLGALGVTTVALPIGLFAPDPADWPAWFARMGRRLGVTAGGLR